MAKTDRELLVEALTKIADGFSFSDVIAFVIREAKKFGAEDEKGNIQCLLGVGHLSNPNPVKWLEVIEGRAKFKAGQLLAEKLDRVSTDAAKLVRRWLKET